MPGPLVPFSVRALTTASQPPSGLAATLRPRTPAMGDQEVDYSGLPLTERFVHKIWKVRKQGYEDAARTFEATPDESDAAFRPFLLEPGLWKGAVADSNVAAQQDGINALCAFLKFGGPEACTRSRSNSITPLVEKGLSSTRAATKASALEALLLYVELDKAAPVIDDLVPALSHKQPKIIAATLAALTAIYHAYGCKTADPKPVLKALPKIFGHADKNVRAEAQNLVVELYRWLREAMKPAFWNDLKPVQQQDLDALFEKVKQEPVPRPERLLRSQQAAAAAAAAAPAAAAGYEEADAEADDDRQEVEPVDLFEPADVMSKVPKDLQESLASTKWKDRKEALDALHAAVDVPRIKDADFGEVARSLAKCMKDANIAVVTVSANCVEALAKGLRKAFARYRSIVMAPMMERLKEKKQAVADALGAALDAVFLATSLSECLEDALEFLKHKNPQVKLESVRFLIRSLRTTRAVPSKAEAKLISDAATKMLTESTEVLRSSAAEVLGTLMKILGERAMGPYLDGLDEIRKTKIREYHDAAEVKAKEKPKAAPAPAAPKARAAPAPKKVFGQKAVNASAKKAAPAPAPVDEAPTPLQPKLTARAPAPSKLTGPPKSGISAPGGGLKLQRKLAGPGTAAATSPKRPTPQAPMPEEEAVPAPRLGLGRGLAGRPLGKPGLAAAPSEAPAHVTAASNLSAVERAELDELRADKERLQRANEDLRSERSKLHSQIHELQNQNAQLIEDHTRDVLSIKAKETQLVRARSDAEAAEQMCQKQQREIERLKRELSRSVRATSPGPADVSEQIYRDAGMAGLGMNGSVRPAGARPLSFAGYSEEKENGDPDAVTAARRSKMVSPSMQRAGSGSTTGRGSPARERESGGGASQGEGIESWKRAAEVTSQLKARIEQMKARQGISRP
ncbi:MAG: Cytoskeleton associated protein 5 [Thelocarpon impressellum]|nr:MAG: Cytoskeleton associated protein 5 [Thelocarpon impressellum]